MGMFLIFKVILQLTIILLQSCFIFFFFFILLIKNLKQPNIKIFKLKFEIIKWISQTIEVRLINFEKK